MHDSLNDLFKSRSEFIPGTTIEWGYLDGAKRVVRRTRDSRRPHYFEIASITKVMTASLLKVLARRGVVSFDTQLGEALAELHLSKEVANITLRQLATHTSGLPRLPQNLHLSDDQDPYAEYGRAELFTYLEAISDGQIIDGRGSREYSNLGFGLLGTVLAVVSGQSFEELLDAEIVLPLGLADTFVSTRRTLAQRAPGLSGHNADGEIVPAWTQDAIAPAGGVVSTASDLLKYAQAVLECEHDGIGESSSWVTDGSIRWHNGQTGGHHSMLALDLHGCRAIVALWDAAYSLDDICIHVLKPERPLRTLPSEVAVDRAMLELYAGIYDDEYGGSIEVAILDEHLTIKGKRFPGKLYPRSTNEFFSKRLPEVDVSFAYDSAGPKVEMKVQKYANVFGGMTLVRAIRQG